MKLLLGVAVLLAIAALATLWRAAAREGSAEAAYPPAGQFININGTSVHYIEAGQGPPLVLIHGSSGNVNDWSFAMMDRLSDRYRVIAFDRPGLGYTPVLGTDATVADQARLLADAAAALGAERPIVLGHSFGGAIALSWALERPDNLSGLMVLAGVSHPWSTGIGTYYRLLSNPISGPIMAALLVAWVPDRVVESSVDAVFQPQSAPEGYAEHFGPGLTLRRFSMLENARQRATLLSDIEAMAPRYGQINVPTAILHGDLDAAVPLQIHARPLSQAVPGAEFVVLDGIGHMPQHSSADTIERALDDLAERANLR